MSFAAKLADEARAAVEGVRRRGATGVRARAHRVREVFVQYRRERPDRVQEAVRFGIEIHLYLDGRYAVCETNDLSRVGMEGFLDDAVAMARAMAADEHRALPDPALYGGSEGPDLGLYDPVVRSLAPEDRHLRARDAERAALEAAGDLAVSVEASCEDEEVLLHQAHSDGFEGSVERTEVWTHAEVSVRDEGSRRPSGWATGGSRFRDRVPGAEGIGEEAAGRAAMRRGARPVETGTWTMIVENRAAGRLLGQLLEALDGRALQQRCSFLAGRLGDRIGSDLLDATDDPLVPGGFGSRSFDAEGIAARSLPLFERGVLGSYYLDTYYGRKLGMAPTTGSRSNVVVRPGPESPEDLVGGVERGIIVRGFLGGSSNTTTGDFSLGIHGTLVEGGAPTRAVAETNIAGRHGDLWHRLAAVGNDPWPYGRLRVPTLVFEGVRFSGSGGGPPRVIR